MGPVDARARAQMPFQVVGMQLDHTGGQEIALQIRRARRDIVARGNGGDDAILKAERAPDHALGQHEAGIGKHMAWVIAGLA